MDEPNSNYNTNTSTDEKLDLPSVAEAPDSDPHEDTGPNEYHTPINGMLARFLGWLFKTNSNHIIAAATVVTAVAAIFYTIYAGKTLDAINGQLEQMKSGSAQTDRLITETHTLAENAGKQASNAKEQVGKLGDMVNAANKQAGTLGGQLAVMQNQLRVADRPWIKADLAVGEALHFAGSGMASIGITFTIANIGRSPATNISSVLFAVPMHPPPLMEDSQSPLEKQKSNCTGAFKGDMSWGQVLFPGQSITHQARIGVTPQALPESCCRGFPPDYPVWNQYYAVVVGCVDYQYASDTRHHQTGFAFQVQTKSTPTSFGIPLTIGVDMSIESLELSPYIMGGRYAN